MHRFVAVKLSLASKIQTEPGSEGNEIVDRLLIIDLQQKVELYDYLQKLIILQKIKY